MADSNKNTKMNNDINLTEVLMQISSDVAVIKNDFANMKTSQKEKEEAREAELRELKNDVGNRFKNMQTAVDSLKDDIDILKGKKDTEDAKKWRKVTSYMITAVLSIIAVKIPDIIKLIISALAGE